MKEEARRRLSHKTHLCFWPLPNLEVSKVFPESVTCPSQTQHGLSAPQSEGCGALSLETHSGERPSPRDEGNGIWRLWTWNAQSGVYLAAYFPPRALV